ncbi:helix-turn-helix transcriptional regulator [Intestinimonas sp.]|uniref:helix-turn-helix domain-containing protein n=1 Tax=Intestinimonas sp. TaxID=1965293 RepID=UPI00260A3E89|nr:helix-turn-helix transcriptional regulator [Intestinimonas sp.]
MFSEKLRLLRQENGLTQTQTAERVGISWRTYQDLEAGKYPSYVTLLKIADTFQVSVDWLMGRTEDREVHRR